MIPRASWGADQVPPRSGPSYGAVQAAFVHHTAGTIEYGPEESPGIVLGIARYHRESNGWNDIGYNFLVDRYGNVFEGRAGGIEAAVIGAQAQGFNSDTTGIACLGTFTALPLDEAGDGGAGAADRLEAELHGVPVNGQVTLISGGGATNRYPAGTPVVFERISGHRDANQTTCPGDQLYAQLPDLRTRASRYAFAASGITVKAASQKGAQPVSVLRPAALRRRLLARGRPARRRVHDRRERLDPDRHHRRRARRRLGDERRAPRQRPGPRRVRAATAPARGWSPRRSSIKVVPSMTLTSGQAARQGGHGVRGQRHALPRSGEGRMPARAPGSHRWVQVQRKRINVRGGAYETTVRPKKPGLYRVSIIAERRHPPPHAARRSTEVSADVRPQEDVRLSLDSAWPRRCRTRSGPPVIAGSCSCWPRT